jgi:hypothetical protein
LLDNVKKYFFWLHSYLFKKKNKQQIFRSQINLDLVRTLEGTTAQGFCSVADLAPGDSLADTDLKIAETYI